MNIFSKLFDKPKQKIIQRIVTCSKHGVVHNFAISIVGGKEYWVCWDCIGEFGTQYCTVEIVEERIFNDSSSSILSFTIGSFKTFLIVSRLLSVKSFSGSMPYLVLNSFWIILFPKR